MRKTDLTTKQRKWWMTNYNQVLHNAIGKGARKSRKPPELFAAFQFYIDKTKELKTLKTEIINKFCN